MALNVYNSAKHHVGLGPVGGSLYGFLLSGAYSKEMQREGLGGQDFGGSTDLIGQIPSLSRWTQDDFTGGAYQEDWTKDVAMFSSCKNFISEAQSRALMTVPPLTRIKAFLASSHTPNFDTPDLPVRMLIASHYIFTLFHNGIHRYDLTAGTDLWHQQETILEGDGVTADVYHYVDMRYDPQNFVLLVLRYGIHTDGTGLSVPPHIKRFNLDFSDTTHNTQWDAPSSVSGDKATGFTTSPSGFVLAASNKLFTGAAPTHPERVDASVTWTEIGRLPGNWIDSCTYNGRTYILCSDTHKTTSIVAFDGTSIMPIATFPWSFNGTCMVEYAGRIYVGGSGSGINGTADSGQLYEVTGASVRLVRSFAPLDNKPGSANFPIPLTINALQVSDGLLWMNCQGYGLIAYDVTSDGLFGASEYQQSADFDIYRLVGGWGKLWGWGHSVGGASTRDGLYRIAQPGDTISAYTAQLVTSDLAYEVAVKKRLSQLKVMTRYQDCTADISTDGGYTWTALTRTANQVDGYNHVATFDLTPIPTVAHWRFRINIAMGTDPSAVGELVAYTCDFAFLDTGKRAWTLVVNGSDEIEGRDGHSVTQDVPLTGSTLWQWAQQQTKLTYTDLNGDTANVQIQGFRENQPVIGPNVGSRPEAFYALSLIEV